MKKHEEILVFVKMQKKSLERFLDMKPTVTKPPSGPSDLDDYDGNPHTYRSF